MVVNSCVEIGAGIKRRVTVVLFPSYYFAEPQKAFETYFIPQGFSTVGCGAENPFQSLLRVHRSKLSPRST